MDVKVFRVINQMSGRSSLVDHFMILVSNKVRYVYFLILIVMWFKKHPYKQITNNAVISAIVTLVMNSFFKLFIYKPRPFIKKRVGILIPSKLDSSFPSKHTLLVFAVSTSVLLYNRVLGSIMFGLAVMTGLSRIWVGHHYPSDIIGSALLGSLTSMFVHIISRSKSNFDVITRLFRFD
ncbi:undecaprenyl-diphosphatase [Bacillus sp. JJ1533]|uniref:undecaprenyl-diphosphatase n=1 Tax=Bacillus sp. JJ1533 TaxID=3122959 RepID=UPI002FFD87B3